MNDFNFVNEEEQENELEQEQEGFEPEQEPVEEEPQPKVQTKKKTAQKAQTEQPSAKKARRGLGSARGTTRLKFDHSHAKSNGLFHAYLESVEVNPVQIRENAKGMASFAGLEVPRLTLTFASPDEDPAKRKYAYLSFMPVESLADRIPGASKEWIITSVFDWLKHILNVYVLKGREMTDQEIDALSLDFEDYDEQGEYVPVDTEVVIDGWKRLFTNFAAIMNTGNKGKPYFKTAENKNIPVWIKLLRYIKRDSKWQPITNGELVFPVFVEEGCIEIYKQNTAPCIRLNQVKESIRPMDVEKPKAPNLPAGGVIMPSIPTNDPMLYNEIAQEAETDLPF